jgi:Ni,Fe-hydrogenase III component G
MGSKGLFWDGSAATDNRMLLKRQDWPDGIMPLQDHHVVNESH